MNLTGYVASNMLGTNLDENTSCQYLSSNVCLVNKVPSNMFVTSNMCFAREVLLVTLGVASNIVVHKVHITHNLLY